MIKIEPFCNESFSSFIIRFCIKNVIDVKDLFTLVAFPTKHHLTYSEIQNLDYHISKKIDYNALNNILNLDIDVFDTISNLKFHHYCLRNDIKLVQLNRIYHTYRRYCPLCLENKPYFKKIWQHREEHSCSIHNISLIDSCPTCHKRIPLFHEAKALDCCPSCGNYLTPSIDQFMLNNIYSQSSRYDFLILSSQSKTFNYGLNFNKDLLIAKFIELSNASLSIHLTNYMVNKYFSLVSLLNWSHELGYSLFDLIDMTYHEDDSSTRASTIQYKCMNQWTSCLNTSIELKKSHLHKKYQNKLYNIYFCPICSYEYIAVDSELIEIRGLSIISPSNLKSISKFKTIKSASKFLKISNHTLSNILLYLITNHLVDHLYFDLKYPQTEVSQLQEKVKHCIEFKENQKEAMSKYHINYRTFQYYYLKFDVYNMRHKRKYHWASRPPNNDEREAVTKVIEDYISQNIPITIKKISLETGFSVEKIRYLGFNPLISSAKKCIKRLEVSEIGKQEELNMEEWWEECWIPKKSYDNETNKI